MGESGPTEHRTFCRFCAALCGVVVTVDDDRVVRVRGDADHPLSRGYTCPKGRALGAWHHHPDRLDHPQLRRDGVLHDVSWDECLTDAAARIAAIVEESGPDAVAVYMATASSFDGSGGRIAHALHRALGSRSRYTAVTIDTPCRPFVFDLMAGTATLAPAIDHDTATLTLLVGTNPVVSHGHSHGMPDPVVRLRALASDGRELWVVDPRLTETARLATRHLPVRPGADHALLAYLVRELLGPDGGADHGYLAAHATGVDQLAGAVAPYTLDVAAAATGLPTESLTDLLAAIRRHGTLVVQTGTGATMSAAANVTEWLAAALQVVTHSYEQPGGAWFHPGFLKCYDRRTMRASEPATTLPPGPPSRPDLPGFFGEYPCAALVDEIEAGNIRALVVIGGNPLTALPETDRVAAALSGLEVLMVGDVVATETVQLATHVLPCTGQLERADVPDYVDQYVLVVASQYTPAVLAPGADRRPLWWSMARLAELLGHDVLPPGLTPDTCTDDDLLAVYAARGRNSFEELRAAPSALIAEGPTRGWVEERVLPDGRWRLAPTLLVDQLATVTPDPAPLVLVPRRQLRTMNSQLRDAGAPGAPLEVPAVHLHPLDAADAGLAEGDPLVIASAAGSTSGTTAFDAGLRRGVVSVPHGYAAPHVGALTSTTVGVDPLTGMVRQSGVAVTVRTAGPPRQATKDPQAPDNPSAPEHRQEGAS